VLGDVARLMPLIEDGTLSEADLYARERGGGARRRAVRGGRLCPVCCARAPRFLPFGLAGRPDARCPGCGSLERHRFLWLWMSRRTRLLSGRRMRVLHVAPEPCLSERLRALHGRGYAAADRFDPAADVRADLSGLPLPDRRFDVAIACHVLEHVDDDRAAMAELARVLRPGGLALVMVPFDPDAPTREEGAAAGPAARMAAYGHPFHRRIYGADLPDRLRAAGLEPETVDSRRALPARLRRLHRVNRNHLFACRRHP
jgi:SAM-dependent methyltransferase